ncbi:MAG: TetR/AcrR family transcriptional regulator [Solirubrobacteraceae bacterium]|nr:TetR/AcrR family transcriptional regulator [Solirubrobacteraceae bacterium]
MPSSPASEPRARNARGQGELLREQLLDAAQELVDEQGGVAQLSIRAVTKRAGVSPMALYLHFADRGALVYALVARGFSEFRAAVLASRDAADGPRARIEAMGSAYLAFAREQPALYSVIFGPLNPGGDRKEAGDKPLTGEPIGRESFEDLVEAVVACQAAGQARAGDAHDLAIGMWAALHGYATLRYARSGVGWPEEEAYARAVAAAWLG